MLGTVTLITSESHPEIMKNLELKDYDARIERGFLMTVEGFDWNCRQHITPRWTAEEIKRPVLPLHERINDLR